MAEAQTYNWEKGNFISGSCDVEGCDGDVKHRLFWYPTSMNGDAECVLSLCEDHKQKKGSLGNRVLRDHKKNQS